MNATIAKCDEADSIGDLYDRICNSKMLLEASIDNDPDSTDPVESEFGNIAEISISIQTDTSIGRVEYRAIVNPGSPKNTLIGQIINDEVATRVHVTRLPTRASNRSLNITIYDDEDGVLDTFVTTISFIDHDEQKLNIIKQELVS